MAAARKPDNETARLQALRALNVLDTAAEQGFDDVTLLASTICNVPICLVSLIDQHRQWFKSKRGLTVEETPRDQAFCAHAILEPGQIMEVPDATAVPWGLFVSSTDSHASLTLDRELPWKLWHARRPRS